MKKLLFILLFLPILSQGQLLYGDSLQLTGVVGTGVRNISVTENGVLIEYSNIEGVRDTLSILTDSISAHNLRLITLEGKNYILFNDVMMVSLMMIDGTDASPPLVTLIESLV